MFEPTAEQKKIIEAFQTGKDMVIAAGAGTGKTTTLRLLGESTERNGLYIAYNKAIQTDAEASFPANVRCRTAHSLAYGGVIALAHGKALLARLNGPRVLSKEAVSILGIPAGGFEVEAEKQIPAWIIARSASEAVGRFCNSADVEITERHVKKLEGIEDQYAYAKYVVPFAKKAWNDINDPRGRLKFVHDHYLKIWALTKPTLKVDFVLLDEAQDANPVIADIVESQTHAQQVMVGDANQAIYGWRGAVDAMTSFSVEHRLMLTESFRFGPAVAEVANQFLTALKSDMRLTGFKEINSKVDPMMADPDVILCRTNAAVIEYAVRAQEGGKKVAIVGGTNEIEKFAEGAALLKENRTTPYGDLSLFKNWVEVVEYAEGDEGRDLRVMVKLIQEYGTQAILDICKASVKEDKADLIVSTAHKAKGREWNRVLIAGDFKAPEEGEEISAAELMLAYVAVTRAKQVLCNLGLGWIDNYMTEVEA